MTLAETLSQELQAVRLDTRCIRPGDEENKPRIDAKIAEVFAKAKFLLEQHGNPTEESGVQTVDPIPLNLPEGKRINVELVGYRYGQSADFTQVDCAVSDADEKNATPLVLFDLSYVGAAWWDGRDITLKDAQFMGELVGHVYNNTFVTAGE